MGHQGWHVEDHVGSRAVLYDVAVTEGLDLTPLSEHVRVKISLDPRTQRTEGIETLGSGELTVATLQVASGHIVGDGVSEDDISCLLSGYVATQPADHNCQFTFVVEVAGLCWVEDRVTGPDHGGVWLEEHQRLRRHLGVHLLGMGRIVSADADDLAARDDRRQQSYVFESMLLIEQLDPHIEWITGQSHDDRIVCWLTELVDLPRHDAELGFLTSGESRDTHPRSL